MGTPEAQNVLNFKFTVPRNYVEWPSKLSAELLLRILRTGAGSRILRAHNETCQLADTQIFASPKFGGRDHLLCTMLNIPTL
jgi:hypothetical protein